GQVCWLVHDEPTRSDARLDGHGSRIALGEHSVLECGTARIRRFTTLRRRAPRGDGAARIEVAVQRGVATDELSQLRWLLSPLNALCVGRTRFPRQHLCKSVAGLLLLYGVDPRVRRQYHRELPRRLWAVRSQTPRLSVARCAPGVRW